MAGGSAPYCILFNDSATTELYTLSLHDALPISEQDRAEKQKGQSDAIDQLETAQPQGDRGKVQHERIILTQKQRSRTLPKHSVVLGEACALETYRGFSLGRPLVCAIIR